MTKRLLILAGLLAAGTATDASAQMTMGSFKSYLTGHIGAIRGESLSDKRLVAGGSVSVQEDNGWGAELDVAHAGGASAGRQVLDVTTYLVNASWVRPRGRVRPFGVAGAGVMQVNGCDAPCTRAARTYDLGLSAGAGAFVVLHDMAGLRADARYFFSAADHADLRRPADFAFWRLSVGATVMWAVIP